jgi:uncharacterized membrane protein (UPF0127 family)
LLYKISSREVRKSLIYVKNRLIFCEVPETKAEIEKGFKHRDFIFEHHGMLFDTHSRYQPLFTMRDVKFDLEAWFIGNDYTVKDIVPMRRMDGSTAYTSPLRIPIRYVIEVSKGYAGRHGIQLGDRVKI